MFSAVQYRDTLTWSHIYHEIRLRSLIYAHEGIKPDKILCKSMKIAENCTFGIQFVCACAKFRGNVIRTPATRARSAAIRDSKNRSEAAICDARPLCVWVQKEDGGVVVRALDRVLVKNSGDDCFFIIFHAPWSSVLAEPPVSMCCVLILVRKIGKCVSREIGPWCSGDPSIFRAIDLDRAEIRRRLGLFCSRFTLRWCYVQI